MGRKKKTPTPNKETPGRKKTPAQKKMGRKKKAPTPNKETPGRKKTPEPQVLRVSCHQCHHRHKQSETISCTNCVLLYGAKCLYRKYKESVTEKDSWKCPDAVKYAIVVTVGKFPVARTNLQA